jgi:hypothetical protein
VLHFVSELRADEFWLVKACMMFALRFGLMRLPPLEAEDIRQIAAKICGNCHEISPTMSPKTAVGPRFEDIANLPSTTALSLKVFLRSSHKRMRNLILSGADSDDVIALPVP